MLLAGNMPLLLNKKRISAVLVARVDKIVGVRLQKNTRWSRDKR